jgi:uncharacterized protein involved in response to NO
MVCPSLRGRPLQPPDTGLAIASAGFRPFFLLAGLHAIATTALWVAAYAGRWNLPLDTLAPSQWHAHEMVYGYSTAVVAGFLLTAIERWTGLPRLRGKPLILLAVAWLIARVLMVGGDRYALPAGLIGLGFLLALTVLIVRPIILAKRWKNLGVAGKLLVLIAGQAMVVASLAGMWDAGVHVGLYLGFYTLIGLILTVARRVVPLFIERGVDQPVTLRNSRLVDVGSMGLYLLFMLAELFEADERLIALLALLLFLLHAARLAGWYTHAIWRKPLLWGLYVSLVWITLGFALRVWSGLGGISPLLTLHAFAYGGLGLVTLAMMARVTLGHTERSVHEPHRFTSWMLGGLALGSAVRVLLPIALPASYLTAVIASQLLWALSFIVFLLTYGLMLLQTSRDADVYASMSQIHQEPRTQ